jgi:multiple sugar transport system ATP-binding protein
MAEVRLHAVSKSFGKVKVVREVNLHIADGEFVVLVGPSGCGKTTTLRMIAGLEEVTSGDILIDGRRVNDVHPKDRDIAMVFQSYALYPHMSVRENMAFGLKMRKLPREEIQRRVEEAARILDLTALLDRKPRELSGGQRQRVAMGRAMVRQPKVFLFDEPLSNLDAKLRVQMRAEIARLHKRLAATIIYVTHDQIEAMTLADRIVVMDAGEVQQVGRPLEVFEHPANRFVAGFIGSPAMNFLPCLLEQGKVRGEGFALELCPAHREKLANHSGPVLLGLRPNHIELASCAPGIEAQAEVSEPMGTETYVHLRVGEQLVTVRADSPLVVKLGDRFWLRPDMSRAHLFDAENGKALL